MSLPIKTYTIKGYTPYVNGVVGHDFRLSFLQRLKILFCRGISVILVDETLRKEKDKEKERCKRPES